MPLADPTAWVSQQTLNQIPGQPPPDVIAAMQGRYDPAVHQWNPQTMTLTGPEGEYYFGGDSYNPYEANPANGTNVVNQDGSVQNFAEGVTPYSFLGGGQAITVAEGSPEYHDLRDDARTRNQQGLARIAALVGGGALGAQTGSGPIFGGSSATPAVAGGAQTFPYSAGGPVTVSSIPGVTAGTAGAGVAGAAGAGGGGAAAGGAAAGGNFLQNWLPEITNGVNALLGARASDQAADAEMEALREAIAEQRRQYDTTREDWAPWMATGRDALNQLSDPGTHFAASPDYAFRRGEGTRDIENSFAARGAGQSGNALRALTEFNSNLASGEFGNWFNRQSTRAGLGTTGTNAVANAGTNTTNAVSDYTTGIGASRASGVIGKYGSLAQGINDGVTNYLYRRRRAA